MLALIIVLLALIFAGAYFRTRAVPEAVYIVWIIVVVLGVLYLAVRGAERLIDYPPHFGVRPVQSRW